MTRFSATALDLSRIDRATIFPALSFQAIIEARMELLRAALDERGIAYDTGSLQSEFARILQRPGAQRELRTGMAIYDATASVLLAWATGLYLDRLGDALRCQRLPAVENPRPFAEAPEDWESDDRYRARIQLAPEALSTAGTPGGYLFHTVSASVDVRDAALRVVRRGTPDVGVEITVLGPQGAPAPALMDRVRDKLFHPQIKLADDALYLRPVRMVDYDAMVSLLVRQGPDAAIVRETARAALVSRADELMRIGVTVPFGNLFAAVHVANVERVRLRLRLAEGEMKEDGDVAVLPFAAARLRNVMMTVETLGD